MKMKLLVTLVISAVLISSLAATVLPSANALTQRTDFSNRHTTASWGNSRVCGDHICKSGEQTEMLMKLSAAQRGANWNGKGTMPTISGSMKMGGNMNDKGTTMPNNK